MTTLRILKTHMSNFPLAVSLTVALLAVSASGAETLWDNGDANNGLTLGWGQYSSTLDDFYVPSGWYIERVVTFGILMNESDYVADVELYVWPHDYDNNEPDGDHVIALNVTSYTAEMTGQEVLDREEIMITVDFESEYLPAQEYYWMEFVVRDQHGHENFRFLARSPTSNNPAWLHFGGGSLEPGINTGISRDLSFILYGIPVKLNSHILSPRKDFKLESFGGDDAPHRIQRAFQGTSVLKN